MDAALAAVPRRIFLHRRDRRRAGADRPIPIGHGQTNSQPTTVRNMLALLDVQPGDRVLDVGSGSGWTTALLTELTGSSGRVYGVELVPEIAEFGRRNLARFVEVAAARAGGGGDEDDVTVSGKHPAVGWADIAVAAPGVLGLPGQAPFDRILVSAEAQTLPQALVDQLAPNGRLVVPVGGRLAVVDRSADGSVLERRVGHYAFVPLR